MAGNLMTRNLFAGVNGPTNPPNLTDLEKKHLPIIDAPRMVKRRERFCMTVEVGKLLAHPNNRDHFIEFIDVYADDSFLARVQLTAINAFISLAGCTTWQLPSYVPTG